MKKVAALGMSVLLTACGGGGGGSDDSTAIAALFTVDPASIAVTSTTTTVPFVLPGGPGFVAFNAESCPNGAGPHNVLVTANAIVYNDKTNSVNASDLEAVAKYADASVQTLRAKFSMLGAVGFDRTNKVRVCAKANGTNGSAGYNDLYIEINTYPNKHLLLAQLIKHELTHTVQAQAMNCQTHQYGYERWLTEGMALRSAGQERDRPAKADIPGLQTSFASLTPTQTPFDDFNGTTFPDFRRYPGYQLAYDTFLGAMGKTDVDVYNFLKNYGATHGCPSNTWGEVKGWKAEFDQYFNADLRGTGVLGTTFWSTAPTYAK